jgi:hypothetical protein
LIGPLAFSGVSAGGLETALVGMIWRVAIFVSRPSAASSG